MTTFDKIKIAFLQAGNDTFRNIGMLVIFLYFAARESSSTYNNVVFTLTHPWHFYFFIIGTFISFFTFRYMNVK